MTAADGLMCCSQLHQFIYFHYSVCYDVFLSCKSQDRQTQLKDASPPFSWLSGWWMTITIWWQMIACLNKRASNDPSACLKSSMIFNKTCLERLHRKGGAIFSRWPNAATETQRITDNRSCCSEEKTFVVTLIETVYTDMALGFLWKISPQIRLESSPVLL